MRHRAELLLLLLLGAFLRLPTFGRPLLSDDEAIYAATADALQKGAVLYRDAVDHKPPLIYFIYRAGLALFGPHSAQGAHLFVVLAVLVTAAILYAIAKRVGGGHREGLIGAGLFLVFSTTWHDYDALAANCELFLLLPQAAAAWLALQPPAGGGRGLTRALAIGALVGLSALCKYQGITFLGATMGLAWFDQMVRSGAPDSPTGRARQPRLHLARKLRALGLTVPTMGLQLVGAAIPPAVFLLYASRTGGLEAALFWFRFNFLYVDAGLTGTEALVRGLSRLAMIGAMAAPVYLLGGAEAISIGARLARRGKPPERHEIFLVLWLATSVVALSAGGRFFGHYFHLILPPLALLAVGPLQRAWRRAPVWRWGLVVATAVPTITFFGLASFARPIAARLDEGDPAYDQVARAIAANSTPDEEIFVWGNSPQLYLLSQRSMGTRFSFCNYMTGESPGTATETGARSADPNSLPIAWEMLFDDLDARRPALFVDAAAAGWDGYDKFPITRYPRLREYLSVRYRPVTEASGVRLYRLSP